MKHLRWNYEEMDKGKGKFYKLIKDYKSLTKKKK